MTAGDSVRINFSRSAATYDAHSRIQQRVGRRLLEHLPPAGACRRILEIGCGTGYYTGLLRQRYPQADVVALDVAAAMIDRARTRTGCHDVQFAVGDIAVAGAWAPYDLVTANASLHWLADIPGALALLAGRMMPRGGIVFSVFGPRTYWELAEVLQHLEPAGPAPVSRAFASSGQMRDWLQAAFAGVQVETRTEVETYPSLLALLRKIKYSGTQGPNPERRRFTRGEIHSLDACYRRRFGMIQATYETIYATARTGGDACQACS
jgi:malonyl-CoA O-methyltransferase